MYKFIAQFTRDIITTTLTLEFLILKLIFLNWNYGNINFKVRLSDYEVGKINLKVGKINY